VVSENILHVQLIDQRINHLASELGPRFSDEILIKNDENKLKSAVFVFLVARTLLDLDDDEVIEGVVEGGGDFGVDAVYFSAPSDGEFSVTLIQGKYKRNLDGVSQFPETGVVKMFDAIRTIFNPSITYAANQRLTKRIEDVRSLIAEGLIPQVRVVFCNNGPRWNDAVDQRIKNSGFGDLVTWEHAGPSALVTMMRARKPVEVKLQLAGKALVEDHPYMRAMVGRMSVLQLAQLFENFGDTLLERNIRRYLGLSGRVNEEIAHTLRDKAQRERFYFFNNGITMICSKFGYNPFSEKDWIVQVSGLQIVNGGQTSKTVQYVLKDLGPEIASAHVLVRIYELPEDDEDLVQRITRATNSQNPVDLRDLRSNDQRQRQLGEMIKELGYTYRRQRSDSSPAPTDLTNATVAEAVLAVWRRRPHLARFMTTEHFGKLYDTIFTFDLNGAQAVIAVLLLRLAENKRKRPPPDAPEFLQYGSRFIAMLMGVFLLDELKIKLNELTYKKFAEAKAVIDAKGEEYFARSLLDIAKVIADLHGERQISLQKLSATFRRADLVQALLGEPLAVQLDWLEP